MYACNLQTKTKRFGNKTEVKCYRRGLLKLFCSAAPF